jgi:hypothetical protein
MGTFGLFLLVVLVIAGLAGVVGRSRLGDRSPPAALGRLERAVARARRRRRRLLLYLRNPGMPDGLRFDVMLGEGPRSWMNDHEKALLPMLDQFDVHLLDVEALDDAAAGFVLGAIGWARQLDELPALFELDAEGRWARRADLGELLAGGGARALRTWLDEPTPVRPAAKA